MVVPASPSGRVLPGWSTLGTRHTVGAMDSTAGIRRASGRWLATAFWPGNTSRDLRFLLASLPAQLAAPAVIALPWLAIWAGRLPGKLTPLLGTAVVVVLLLAAI